jgi:hypothetical protein
MRPYTDLPGFENVLLEGSWVLDIEAHPKKLTVRVDIVLTPEHPAYAPPKPGEMFCYRTGAIRFRDVDRLPWSGQELQPAKDATGEVDWGHIDQFEWGSEEYQLIGDFGRIALHAKAVSVELGSEAHSGPIGD